MMLHKIGNVLVPVAIYLSLTSSALAQTTVYKCKDERGKVTISSTPSCNIGDYSTHRVKNNTLERNDAEKSNPDDPSSSKSFDDCDSKNMSLGEYKVCNENNKERRKIIAVKASRGAQTPEGKKLIQSLKDCTQKGMGFAEWILCRSENAGKLKNIEALGN